MEGGHLAPAQDRAKTKSQLAHDSEARALPLQRIDDRRLLAGQLGGYLTQQRRRHLRDSCVDPLEVVTWSCGASGNPEIALRVSAFG